MSVIPHLRCPKGTRQMCVFFKTGGKRQYSNGRKIVLTSYSISSSFRVRRANLHRPMDLQNYPTQVLHHHL